MTRAAPGLSGAVVQRSAEATVVDGQLREATKITMPPELFEQYRQGYRCPKCHSLQSVAFPEECETVWRDTNERCGFKIKRDLGRWIEAEFKGEEELWPGRDQQEEAYAEQDERDDWTAKAGIWLPGKE